MHDACMCKTVRMIAVTENSPVAQQGGDLPSDEQVVICLLYTSPSPRDS